MNNFNIFLWRNSVPNYVELFEQDGLKAACSFLLWVYLDHCFLQVLLLIHAGVLNCKWSQVGVLDIYGKSIIGLYTTLLLCSGINYRSTGDSTVGAVLVLVGVLESLAAYRAA